MNKRVSFMTRHRTICAVLTEIGEIAAEIDSASTSAQLIDLVNEALDYARRMDAKLVEIRTKEQQDGKDG